MGQLEAKLGAKAGNGEAGGGTTGGKGLGAKARNGEAGGGTAGGKGLRAKARNGEAGGRLKLGFQSSTATCALS